MSVKMSRAPGAKELYQVEYTIDEKGAIWYNLSHENGNPFKEVARYLFVNGHGTGNKCIPFYCAPGDGGTGCDWKADWGPRPDQFVNGCDQADDVYFILC